MSHVTSLVFVLFLFFESIVKEEKSDRSVQQIRSNSEHSRNPHESKWNLSSQNSRISTYIPLESLLSNSPMPTHNPEICPQMPWSLSQCSDICILLLHLAIAFAIWHRGPHLHLRGFVDRKSVV